MRALAGNRAKKSADALRSIGHNRRDNDLRIMDFTRW